ncbi:unnamed protein product [Mytilus edulis]|uniref:TRPM SLOG domain-containing protein n=1 Tax=Mytilus edulis TaxID=6550 RepID=A0A8S3VDP8_MYTED|nr:unnamed protein product [Mytilus edulis]
MKHGRKKNQSHFSPSLEVQTNICPNETIKNQLKNGLQEIMETTNHLNIPIIMIIIGGDENSFVTAMTYLKMNYPVLVLEGSGRAADFICKGYRLRTFRTSEDKCVLCDTFISEMTEAAKYIYGFNQEERMSEKMNCDKLANKLKHALETRWKFIHVHSINDTTNSFDKAIQDILFQLLCKGEQRHIINTIHKRIVGQKEEIVKQVLDYIQDREFFTVFLQQNLEKLYVSKVSPDLRVVILAWSA